MCRRWVIVGFLATGLGVLAGCKSTPPRPDLAELYETPAREIGDDRVPVVVIPGILGSKIEDSTDGTKVWGAFEYGAADADNPDGARRIALPMQLDVPLSQLRDAGEATDVLDTVTVDIGPIQNLEIGAYVDILRTLGAGKYRDSMLGESGAIDYGGLHYTCFQLPYDWRRDVSEQAVALHELILDAQAAAGHARGTSGSAPTKVDVVAHSMGGMVLRYYLRYGPTVLPDDGSLPPLTWEGAQHVRRAVLIGTPNAGSVLSLQQLVRGWDLNPLFPNYRPALLGTMPAIYQLLTRSRHGRVVDATTGEVVDIYDPNVWERNSWGLADPEQDQVLRWLLPDVQSASERRAIALDHQRKCLAKAEQLHRALDAPASPPSGTTIALFAGDTVRTPAIMEVREGGGISVRAKGPGDGTVTRDSALMDERVGGTWRPGLRSPVSWSRVQFVFADHLGLTRDPAFTDNLLFMLLESPSP